MGSCLVCLSLALWIWQCGAQLQATRLHADHPLRPYQLTAGLQMVEPQKPLLASQQVGCQPAYLQLSQQNCLLEQTLAAVLGQLQRPVEPACRFAQNQAHQTALQQVLPC